MKSLTINLILAVAALTVNGFGGPGSGAAKVIKEYCYDCHDRDTQKGSLNLEAISSEAIEANSIAWEKVVRKLNSRQMPPVGKPRPAEKTSQGSARGRDDLR